MCAHGNYAMLSEFFQMYFFILKQRWLFFASHHIAFHVIPFHSYFRNREHISSMLFMSCNQTSGAPLI